MAPEPVSTPSCWVTVDFGAQVSVASLGTALPKDGQRKKFGGRECRAGSCCILRKGVLGEYLSLPKG